MTCHQSKVNLKTFNMSEYFRIFRFCRVCLVPEEDEEQFSSIFDNECKIVKKLHNLTGIIPVDVDPIARSLICQSCSKEVDAADLLRKRILDANERISIMTQEKEIEMFEKHLQQLKTKTDKKEEKKQLEGSKFGVPKVFIDKKKSEPKFSSAKFKSEALKYSSKINLNTKASMQKVAKKKSLESKKETKVLMGGFKSRRKTKRKKIQTSFECGTCLECFSSYQQLNKHLDSHKSKFE